jgi:glycosyl hydrolase family 114
MRFEFDNVDGYQNRTGFPLTGADQLRYNVFLANHAHRRGLTAFLKNDLGQIKALLPYFDAAPDEQCFQYSECGKLKPFLEAGKPVVGVEYELAVGEFCPRANALDFNFLRRSLRSTRGVSACPLSRSLTVSLPPNRPRDISIRPPHTYAPWPRVRAPRCGLRSWAHPGMRAGSSLGC